MSTYNPYLHVKAYLKGTLDLEQKDLFEQELKSNAQLQEIVSNHELYNALADEIINSDIKARIEKIANERKLTNNKSPRTIMIWLSAAASLLMLVFYFWTISNNDFHEELYAQYYSPYISDVTRGSTNDTILVTDDIDEEGLHDSLSKLRITSYRSSICESAHSLLDQNEINLSKELFLKASNSDNIECKEKSEYYLSLIFLKEGDIPRCKSYLDKLLEKNDHSFYDKAFTLRNELEK